MVQTIRTAQKLSHGGLWPQEPSCAQGPAAQEPHTAQAIESGASFMAAVTDATAPMPGMEGDPNQGQQVQSRRHPISTSKEVALQCSYQHTLGTSYYGSSVCKDGRNQKHPTGAC